METIAKYAYEVYKKGSFTKAAKALYISQPSLSAAISRLESDLGFRIFDRSVLPCSLTAAGRIYMESIEEIVEVENNMKRRIKDLSDINHGSITVGGSSYASYLVLSDIFSAFYKSYPDVKATLDIGNTGSTHALWEKLDAKELDILVTYTQNHPNFIVEPILEERLIIAMNRKMPGAQKLENLALTREEILTKSYCAEREIEDMSIFRDFEFFEFPSKSDTDQRMSKLLGNYKPSRYKIENAKHSEMHYNLMCAGIGAVLTNSLVIAQKSYDENILFFVPKSEESYRKIHLAYNYSAKNNPLIQCFIRVAKEVCAAK
jgi:DNA-binding transcriptional LysR family regulator